MVETDLELVKEQLCDLKVSCYINMLYIHTKLTSGTADSANLLTI